VDDAVRKAYTDLTIAIYSQGIRYARGDLSCPDVEDLQTEGCLKCSLRRTCVIVNKPSNRRKRIQADRRWIVTDGVEFAQSIGLEYEREDFERLL
jgi:hypothetical protein